MYTTRLFVLCYSLHALRIEYTPLHTQDTAILPEYVPEARGVSHDMPDGVEVRVRLHRVQDTYQVTHYRIDTISPLRSLSQPTVVRVYCNNDPGGVGCCVLHRHVYLLVSAGRVAPP